MNNDLERAEDDGGPDEIVPIEHEAQVERIANLVVAKIDQKFEQKIEHLHLPMAVPNADDVAELEAKSPRVFELWLELTRKRAFDDADLEKAAIDHPLELAKRGQWFGIVSMLAVLGFCGYLASLGGGAQYVAGVIAAIDLVAIITSFMNTGRNKHSE